MPKQKKEKSENVKSRQIGVRLHPSDEYEKKALAIFDGLVKQGYAPRKIFTDAVLRLDGVKPEMFQDYTKQVTKPYLEGILEDFASHLLGEIRAMALVANTGETVSHEIPITEDEDTEYAKNIAAGYLARRRR